MVKMSRRRKRPRTLYTDEASSMDLESTSDLPSMSTSIYSLPDPPGGIMNFSMQLPPVFNQPSEVSMGWAASIPAGTSGWPPQQLTPYASSINMPDPAVIESPIEQNRPCPDVRTKTWVLDCPNKKCKKLLQVKESMSGKDFFEKVSALFSLQGPPNVTFMLSGLGEFTLDSPEDDFCSVYCLLPHMHTLTVGLSVCSCKASEHMCMSGSSTNQSREEAEKILKTYVQSGSWSVKCNEMMSQNSSGSWLFQFDKLQDGTARVLGDPSMKYHLQNPVLAKCPLVSCKRPLIFLKYMNNPHSIVEHLQLHHQGNPHAKVLEHRWNEYIKNNFISPGDLNSKGGTTESLQLIQPNLTDPTMMFRDITEGTHYLSYWLNLFLSSGVIETTHLQYQELDSLIQEHLQQPHPISNWKAWPVLHSYCSSLLQHAGIRGYNFYLGERNYGRGLRPVQMLPLERRCHQGPHVRTLQNHKSIPVHESGPRFDKIHLLNTLLSNLESCTVVIHKENVQKYLVTLGYDGQPLNQGTFVHRIDNTAVLDGIIPKVTTETMREVGPRRIPLYIKDNCQYISEVREYIATDAAGKVSINVATVFTPPGGSSADYICEIKHSIHALETCTSCIEKSEVDSCLFDRGHFMPCTPCQQRIEAGDQDCICRALKCIHLFSDQASAQYQAHIELSRKRDLNLVDNEYTGFGFGLLHFSKCIVGQLRQYYLTDGTDCHCVSFLTAIWLSETPIGDKLSRSVDSKVFSYRDRHSDSLCYQTVCDDAQAALREAKRVVVTVCPEQYRPFASEAKSHTIIGRPHFIAVNTNGDFLWSDAEYEFIGMGNRHNVTKVKAIGQHDKPGPASPFPTDSSKAQFHFPSGLTVVKCKSDKSGREELCYVCDTGNSVLRCIDKVHSFESKHLVHTVKLQNTPSDFKPFGITALDEETLAVSTLSRKVCILKLYQFTTGNIVRSIDGFVEPKGLCSQHWINNTGSTYAVLLVADKSTVKQIDSRNGNVISFSMGIQDSFDIALDSEGYLAVSEISKHVVHTYKPRQCASDSFVSEECWGSGECGNIDGPFDYAKFDEVAGIAFDGKTAVLACYGGLLSGSIRKCSRTTFSIQLCHSIQQIYNTCGYIPPMKKRSTLYRESVRSVSFESDTQLLRSVSDYLLSLVRARADKLGFSARGPQGSLYKQTVEGLELTVTTLESHIKALKDLNMEEEIKKLNLYAFTNESPCEHSFGFSTQKGQYRHRTMKQYAENKASQEEEFIKRLCQCPFSYHLTVEKAYQAPQKSHLIADDVIGIWKSVQQKLHKPEQLLSPTERRQLDEDVKYARLCNSMTKAQPTHNIRDLYRAKCGTAPCIVQQVDATSVDYTGSSLYVSFFDKIKTIPQHTGIETQAQTSRIESALYRFVPGDIVVVIAEENEDDCSEKWWLLQISRPFPLSKTGLRCPVYGFWLEKCGDEDGLPKYLLTSDSQEQKITYGNIWRDTDGDCIIIPESTLQSGWERQCVTYKLTAELFEKLERVCNPVIESGSSSNSDDDDDNDGSQEEREVARMNLDIVRESRCRIQRNLSVQGRQYSSYLELARGHN